MSYLDYRIALDADLGLKAIEPVECIIIHAIPAILKGGILTVSWYVMNDTFCALIGLLLRAIHR